MNDPFHKHPGVRKARLSEINYGKDNADVLGHDTLSGSILQYAGVLMFSCSK